VKLNPISKEEPTEQRMRWKRKSSKKEGEEKYPESYGWSRNGFRPGYLDFRQIILQDANLCAALLVLLQELGLDPIVHSGRVGIGGLGLGLLCSGRGGTDSGGTSLAHGGGAEAGTHRICQQGRASRAECEEEDDDGSGVG
jgi:hypothetical protein